MTKIIMAAWSPQTNWRAERCLAMDRGLQETARVIEGNVLEVPLADARMDAVISQEAFCHVPDVKQALTEAFRILRKGRTGR